jgi:hypothetical protein
MPLLELKRNPTAREVRQFALGWLPAFCLALAAIAYYRYDAPRAAMAWAGVAAASIVLGLLWPRSMGAVFVAWMWAAWPIGWVVSHVLMGIIYFLVITPIGLAMRMLGRDPLQQRFDRQAETYWTPRSRDVDPASYFRQF